MSEPESRVQDLFGKYSDVLKVRSARWFFAEGSAPDSEGGNALCEKGHYRERTAEQAVLSGIQ